MKKRGRIQRKYSPEFKKSVIMDMREHHLSYHETVRKYWNTTTHSEECNYIKTLHRWERIFLEEGTEGLMKERRGRACKASGTRKGRPPKLDKKVEEDLIAENQRLRMEIEYLKKTECLSSCGRARERQKALIISELRQKYPLKDLLKLSGIARSTFYYYLKAKDVDKHKEIKEEILDVFNKNKGRYGYRRILTVLKNKGYTINHKTVLNE